MRRPIAAYRSLALSLLAFLSLLVALIVAPSRSRLQGPVGCGGAALGDAGYSGFTVAPVGRGLGDPCSASMPCRGAGIVCTGGSCALGATAADAGASCEIGPECSTGQCGPNRTCDPEGSGAVGTSCSGDADCASGLRCAFDGVSVLPKCIPEGNKDYGQPCSTTRDCFQGLTCSPGTTGTTGNTSDAGGGGGGDDGGGNGGDAGSGNAAAGTCTAPPIPPGSSLPHGLPPYVPTATSPPPWAGVRCPAPLAMGSVTARFHVPRTGDPMDGDFYKLPFPNDAARDGSGHVSYANHPHDTSPPVGFDVLKPYLDALSSEPFGNYPTIYFTFNGQFNFGSITASGNDPQLRWVDLTGKDTDPGWGHRLPFQYYTTNGGNKYICPNYLGVRPPRGGPLAPGGVYAIILKTGVTTASDGSLAKPDADMTALLSSAPPADPALIGPYAAYAPLRDYLAKAQPAPIDPSQVLVASVFHVGNPPDAAAHMRPSVRAIATEPAVHNWTHCAPGVTSPCPQHDGARNCGAATSAGFDEYHALVDLPIFQQGTPPYAGPTGGGGIDVSQATTTPVRTEPVCMALTVPTGTPPAGGWPVVIYAHGTGGSFRSHAEDGAAAMLSSINLGGGSTAGFAVLGIDQIGHGPRRCGGGTCTSTESPSDFVFNFGNPQAARFNYVQSAADQHTLVRVVEKLTIDPTVAVAPVSFNPKETVFWGHSQGATAGALFLASDPSLAGAVLSGEAGGFLESLLTKEAPIDIKDGLWLALSESSPSVVNLWHPVLSLLQNWEDPSDPIHFAALDIKPQTAAGPSALARNIFQPSGTGDTYTAVPVQLTYAFAAPLAFVAPVTDETDAAVTPSQASVMGNVSVGQFMSTAALRQYAPGMYDGHFVAYQNPTAQADVAKFLARAAMGQVPRVPE